MKFPLYSVCFLLTGCSMIKESLRDRVESEEDKDEENESASEVSRQGDCLDEDNDDDGYIDCEDQGCDGKPACQRILGS